MKLFFETADQATAFLAAAPLGFLLGLCFGLERLVPWGKALWDVLTFLLLGAALLLLLFWTKESGLRPYHLLAVLTGFLLYRCGVSPLAAGILRRLERFRKKTERGREKD